MLPRLHFLPLWGRGTVTPPLEGPESEEASLPVLIVFLMTVATCPLSTELKSLTIRIRQVQRISREVISRMVPTIASERFKFMKMCWPGETIESPC